MAKHWAVAVVLLGLGGYAAAQGNAAVSLPADEVIAARQAGMDLQGGNLALMKMVIASKGPVKPLAGSAKALAAWGAAIPGLFPDGTQQGHNTSAGPAIWSDRAGFAAAAADFTTAATKLAQLAAADDQAGFATQYAVVGRACGACHRQYRKR